MKSLSGKLGIILFVIGLAVFGYAEVWGADWRLYKGETSYYDAQSIIRQKDGWVRV